MTVGDVLYLVRKQAELTQVELAEISGISKAEIGYIETGMVNPSFGTIVRLADVLHIPLEKWGHCGDDGKFCCGEPTFEHQWTRRGGGKNGY